MQTKDKLSRDARYLILISGFRKIFDVFFGTFLTAFLIRVATSEILTVATYNLFWYFLTAVGYFFVGRWIDRHNKVAMFRASIIPKAIVLGMIIYLKDAAADYVVAMGMIMGIEAAMYWLVYHTMVPEKVHANQMPKFVGYKTLTSDAVGIITPVAMGAVLTTYSYVGTAWLMLGLCAIEAIAAHMIHSSRHRDRTPLDMGGFLRCVGRFPIMKQFFAIEVLRGFSTSGMLATVLTMYKVALFHTDLKVGAITSAFTVMSLMAALWFGRYAKKSMFAPILSVVTVFGVASLAMFIARESILTFLILNLVYVAGFGMQGLICNTNVYLVNSSPCVTQHYRTEYFISRDWALGAGRVVGCVTMLYIGVFGGDSALRWFIAAMMVAAILAGYWSVSISRNLRTRK